MGAALNNHQLSIGNFFRKDSGRLHMVAGSPFVGVLAADDHQRRSFDFMDEIRRLVALSGDDMAQVAFERRHLIDDKILKFFHDLGMLLHELIRKHEAGTPVIVVVFLIAFLNHFNGSIQRNTPRIVIELIAVFS